MPWTPTRAFPHPLADVVATNTDAAITNYVSYALVEMMTWQGLGDLINRFRTNILELDPISLLWAPGLLTRLRIPATYCWSPALTPKPADWAPEITVSGFFFLNLESNYTPEPELAHFLAAGPPPVYIGFGSIVVDDPEGLTQTIFNAIIKSGVRAIVSKGWGGIGGDAADIPEGVFMLGNCPHDWLFKHVAAVVHHGGAGTTAAGIKAGRPTVVVPFFGDQIFWGSMVARSGAGPAPIPYKKLTAENLAAAIGFTLRPETQARARELGERIKQEKGVDVAGKSFHQFLNTDNMRCSLAPSRVAVWRVRRSKVRLSALAAAVLVKQGWLKYSDLKL
jgi:UDP:flavonoid glycosyltransferase YjiC (YdhE family)